MFSLYGIILFNQTSEGVVDESAQRKKNEDISAEDLSVAHDVENEEIGLLQMEQKLDEIVLKVETGENKDQRVSYAATF